MAANSPDQVVVYEAPDGEVRVDVRLERETVRLSQVQMAELFGRERSVITRHVRNVFREGELEEESNVHFLHIAGSDRPVGFYSLDVVISVGYRVKSQRGTQFRIWATRTLRDHLLRGYTLHERRLAERGLGEVEQAVGLLARTLTTHALVTGEGRDVLEVVQRYTRSWRLLLEYDEERLAGAPARPGALRPGARRRSGGDRRRNRADLRRRAALPERAGAGAHLLYFVIKDHPFSDGNKRIGTLLFLEYLRRNGLLLRADGEPRLADNAMVALALLVAESDPAQKELMIRLVLNLLEDDASYRSG